MLIGGLVVAPSLLRPELSAYGSPAMDVLIGGAIVIIGGGVLVLAILALVTFCVPLSVKEGRKEARAQGHKTLFR